MFFYFFVFSPYFFYGQNSDIKFHNPNLRLSDNSIRAIIEDYKGFMWFGTEGGLNKFDGVNMNVYEKISNDSTGLSNNKILCLYQTKNNELWIGTASGLNLYNRNKNNFTQFYYNHSNKLSANYNVIKEIVEDDNGDLWIATQGGTCFFDREKNKLVSFKEFTKSKQNFEDKLINTIIIDKEGRVIAGTDDSKLYKYDKHKGTITELYLDNGGFETSNIEEIRQLTVTNNGSIWISTVGTGLFKIKKIQGKHIWYDTYLNNPNNYKSISYNDINRVCDYKKDEILVGTINGGLNIFNYKKNTFKRFQKNLFETNSIRGNSIWSIYKDSKNNIWIGVFNVGINIIYSIPPKFTTYQHNHFNKNSLTHSSITSFLEDSVGNMWITSDGGGLDYWNRTTNKFTNYRHNPNNNKSLLSNAGLCLCEKKDGEIWAGFFGGGINILEKDKKTFRHITTKDGLSNNNVFSIVENKSGETFISCFGGGLNVYNDNTKKIKVYKNKLSDSNTIGNNDINILFIDSKNRLWIGFNDGGLDLMKHNRNNKVNFIHYKHSSANKNSISDNTILSISEDKKGNIWIGTRDGLNMFDVKTNKFIAYRKSDGLPSNTVVGIIEDDNNNLWLSTLNGLSMFNHRTKVFRNYTESDGLQGQKFNNRASYYKNTKGELFFGGNKGFSTFNPNKIKYDYSFPNLYITSFKLFNEEVEINGEISPLKKHITETSEITLTHKQSVFTFEYVAIHFKDYRKIKYAYTLEGLEKKWNFVGNKRTATYTNLDAGNYIFKVKSTNIEGDWNKNATTIKITILPAWWSSWWFRALIIISVLLGLYSAYIIKIRNYKKQKAILKVKVSEKTKKLHEANTVLEEINEEVLQQKEELEVQKATLEKTNNKLAESTNELSKHKNNLEKTIKIRTTELERAKNKAEESDRLKTAFLTNMSHEIRTPMNAIVGFSQLLNDKITENDKKEYINQINSNTNSLLMLIEDILDISMIEANKIIIKNKKFEVNTLLKEVVSDCLVLNKKGIVELRIINKEENNNIIINSDRIRIKQVLINLFNNACKFTEEGYIELGFEIKTNKLQFYVKDTGIGISKDGLKFIFDRFRKVDVNKAKLFRGTGLGLAISKKIAQLLNGDLTVKSELVKGSVFYFSLPKNVIANKQIIINKIEIKNIYNWQNKRILIVEDEKANYVYLTKALKKTKAKVIRAIDGRVAVELFRAKEKFDIVLMDIKMPVVNGYDATILIKKIIPEQIVIAQTAYARNQDKAKKSGFNDYLIKPIKPEILLSTIAKYL